MSPTSRLFSRELTEPHRAILRTAEQLLADLAKMEAPLEGLRARSDALIRSVHSLPPSNDPLSRSHALEALVLGTLAATRYAETVEKAPAERGGEPSQPIDTISSPTLSAFQTDASRAAFEPIKQRLRLRFGDRLVERAEQKIRSETLELTEKLRLRAALEDAVRGQSRPATALFDRLFPGHPLRPEEIDLIATNASFFFVVPAHDGKLLREPPDPNADAFLHELLRLDQTRFARFPMFSGFDGRHIEPATLAQVSIQAGLTELRAADRLTTMVTVLPREKLEQYLVHDTFGHQWQSLLFSYEDSFRAIGSYTGELDEGLDTASLRELIARRVHTSIAGLVAEILADVVEHKLLVLRPELASVLLSSSITPDRATKVDLTLVDLRRFFEFATGALTAPSSRASAAARALVGPAGMYVDADGQVTPLGTLALAFLRILGSLEEASKAAGRVPLPPGFPFARHHDALVFYAAAYLEADWSSRFWSLDEAVDEFPGLWAELVSAP
ncbi:MAG: hypothetical protein HYV07_18990 [Deltaproteobacteria bacterium]|nr:hypothetical protein [Deltaproteobacteria bacterium]